MNGLEYRQAWNEGYRGDKLADRITQLRLNRTPEMMEQASKAALEGALMGPGGQWARMASEFMEWPAPPSGVVGSPANQEEEGMDISVLGVDLGKNVCSVVGLDASGAVVMRRKVRRETLIALAEKLPRALSGWRPAAGLIISVACSPPTATTFG